VPTSSPTPVRLAAVVRDGIRLWRRHFWFLTSVAALVWLPLAILELSGIAHGIEIDTAHFDAIDLTLNVVILLVFELLAAELLAAASEKIVAADLRGVDVPSRREFLGSVPWGTLVLGTLVYEVGVFVGLAFFVVPGFVFAVWGVVTGPVIVAERGTAFRAPGRSRALVRGSFRPVAGLVLLGFLFGELLSTTTGELFAMLPQEWVEPTGEYLVHVITSPLFGMATAVLYYALLGREREQTRNEPAEAGSSS
jgi:hypothetical protein